MHKEKNIYQNQIHDVWITLVCKDNGGKADALNTGITLSQYEYIVCIDADVILKEDALNHLVQPLLYRDTVIAVGGCIYPYSDHNENLLIKLQKIEYDRSFHVSRIFMDFLEANMIISGAFGLFKKEIVIQAGGYDTDTVGEDMELVLRLHEYCLKNHIPYEIEYIPEAVCYTQVPDNLHDLFRQRRRWQSGLLQCMKKHMFFPSIRFMLVNAYFWIYECLSPLINLFGIILLIYACITNTLHVTFYIIITLIFMVLGLLCNETAVWLHRYKNHEKFTFSDLWKTCILSILETLVYQVLLFFPRAMAFIDFHHKKSKWEHPTRRKMDNKS